MEIDFDKMQGLAPAVIQDRRRARHLTGGSASGGRAGKPLPGDGRGLRADRARTAHLRVPCARRDLLGEEGVAVLDRIQPWLATLLALNANSPFWQGADSAYASFRYQAWGRWPSSGPTGQFGLGCS